MTIRPMGPARAPRVDAAEKVSGQAIYAGDIQLPGMCHAAVVRSTEPRARLLAVDPGQALEQPGVIGVFSAADFPVRLFGRRVRDVPIFASGAVRFVGERVAAVVAETREAAELAAVMVRVDYEPLPAVLDAEAALAEGAPAVHEAPWKYPGAVIHEHDGRNLQAYERHGSAEVEAALGSSTHTVEAVYTTPSGHQGYLEPQACVARVSAAGHVEVWSCTKSPYALRRQLAECFEIEPETITVHPVAVGGDFGGKGSPMDVPLCVELSRRVGRPVRLALRYWEDLTTTNPRHSARVRVRAGCDAQGRLTALAVESLLDGGAYAGFKPVPTVVPHGAAEPGTSYRIPAVRVEARAVYTNTVPRGHMRAPGAPQVVFAVESALDELAAAAGLDAVELRRRNLLRAGEPNPYGEQPVQSRGLDTLEAALKAFEPLPAPHGWLHGVGVAVYDRATRAGSTSLRLLSDPEGRLHAQVPFPEQGGGSHTAVREGLAQLLGMPPELIAVEQVSTDELPHDDGVGGTRVTASLSRVIGRAAAAWQEQDGGPVTVLVEREPGPSLRSYCVQVAQVGIDPETGQVQVLEVLTAADVAQVLNPIAHRLQLDGGAAMGYGFGCLEDLALSEGHVWAANLGEFRLPSSADVPRWRTVLVPGGRGIGELNVKAAGELSNVPTAAAIANAVAAAAGVRIRDLPITAEKVHTRLRARVAL